MIRSVLYIAAIILFMDQIYVATPLFHLYSEVVSAMLGLYPTHEQDLIQLGAFDMTGVSRYETDEQNVQQT